MFECVDVLYYIYFKEYLYNDLKGDNVIINEIYNSLYFVIIDFGKFIIIVRVKFISCF